VIFGTALASQVYLRPWRHGRRVAIFGIAFQVKNPQETRRKDHVRHTIRYYNSSSSIYGSRRVCARRGRHTTDNTPYEDPPYAVVAAEQMLSDELGFPVDDSEYPAYEPQDWPDACLGLAEEDEVCAQVITPGWRVVLAAEGQEYVFRTDANGAIVRRES